MYGCIYGLVRSLTVLYGLTGSLMVLYDRYFEKPYTAFTDTLEWPEYNSDKATVGLVVHVCTVYTDGQPYKPCVLCQTGFK